MFAVDQQPRQSNSLSLSGKAPPPADATAGGEDSSGDSSSGSMDEVPAVDLTSPTPHDVKVMQVVVLLRGAVRQACLLYKRRLGMSTQQQL